MNQLESGYAASPTRYGFIALFSFSLNIGAINIPSLFASWNTHELRKILES